MSNNLTPLTMDDFLKMFHEDVWDKIKKACARKGVSHIVCCETLDFWSPHLGDRTAVIVGDGCTYKLEDFLKPGARIGDVPSRFKYPVAYAAVGRAQRPKKKARK